MVVNTTDFSWTAYLKISFVPQRIIPTISKTAKAIVLPPFGYCFLHLIVILPELSLATSVHSVPLSDTTSYHIYFLPST